MSPEQEIAKIESDLKIAIIGFYEPVSTRWHRNYSDRAEWYFLWKGELKVQNK